MTCLRSCMFFMNQPRPRWQRHPPGTSPAFTAKYAPYPKQFCFRLRWKGGPPGRSAGIASLPEQAGQVYLRLSIYQGPTRNRPGIFSLGTIAASVDEQLTKLPQRTWPLRNLPGAAAPPQRNPMLLLRLFGLLLFRLAERKLFQLLFQPPPRSTLLACPYNKQAVELVLACLMP